MSDHLNLLLLLKEGIGQHKKSAYMLSWTYKVKSQTSDTQDHCCYNCYIDLVV